MIGLSKKTKKQKKYTEGKPWKKTENEAAQNERCFPPLSFLIITATKKQKSESI